MSEMLGQASGLRLVARIEPIGEGVTEVLEYVPGRFRVVRHVRP